MTDMKLRMVASGGLADKERGDGIDGTSHIHSNQKMYSVWLRDELRGYSMQCHLGNSEIVKGLIFLFQWLTFLHLIPPQNTWFRNKIPLQEILLMQQGKLFFPSKIYHWHIKSKQHAMKIYRKSLHLEKGALWGF